MAALPYTLSQCSLVVLLLVRYDTVYVILHLFPDPTGFLCNFDDTGFLSIIFEAKLFFPRCK